MAESIVKKTEQRCVVSSDFGQGFLLSFRIGINVIGIILVFVYVARKEKQQ